MNAESAIDLQVPNPLSRAQFGSDAGPKPSEDARIAFGLEEAEVGGEMLLN
jgi:hypothetical protein